MRDQRDTFQKQIGVYVQLGAATKRRTIFLFMSLITVCSLLFIFPLGGSYTFHRAVHSGWMVFYLVTIILDMFGILLYIRNRPFAVVLYEGIAGVFMSLEFFGIGIIIGAYLMGISAWILVSLWALDVPLVLWILRTKWRWYQTILSGQKWHETFRRKKRSKKKGRIFLGLEISIIILAGLLGGWAQNAVRFNTIPARMENMIGLICFFFLGYVFSAFVSYFLNYYVAIKHKEC